MFCLAQGRAAASSAASALHLCANLLWRQQTWWQQRQQQAPEHTQQQQLHNYGTKPSPDSSNASTTSSDCTTAGSSGSAAPAHTALGAAAVKEPETPLLQTIRNRIMVRGGPLSVADYMQEVLTNPHSGYYMQRDVFGRSGDFTTSPEISQMFGEMLGIWCVVLWHSLGCPAQLDLVELGPGRGTLMADLLRGTAAFKGFAEALEVHMVEVSPFLRQQQWDKLQCSSTGSSSSSSDGGSSTGSSSSSSSSSSTSDSGVSALNGAQVSWHSSLDAVPSGRPCIYIAHEFLDALPVHQFVKDARRGWLEVMVDTADDQLEPSPETPSASAPTSTSSTSSVPAAAFKSIPLVSTLPPRQQQQQQQLRRPSDQGHQHQQPAIATTQQSEGQRRNHPGQHLDSQHLQEPQEQQQQQQQFDDRGLHLRFVLSPSPTPAAQLLVRRRLAALDEAAQQQTQAIEIGARAMATVESLARRIAATGGAALLIDYGANKPYADSLTGIRGHSGVHPLSQPGSADLSAWVDFSAMRMAAEQALDLEHNTAAAAAAGTSTAQPLMISTEGLHGDAPGNLAHGSSMGAQAAGSADAGGAGVQVWGPIPQAHLLHSLGIQARLQALTQSATPAQAEGLISGYKRLVDMNPGGMGASYLAMAITQQGLEAPVGFEQLAQGSGGAAEACGSS